MILGDPERLEAALDCLIENSVKFTGPRDGISISAHAYGDEVWLKVADTGAGMPKTDRALVTEVLRTGSNAGEGAASGLGLSIVRAIVESRGGRKHQPEARP